MPGDDELALAIYQTLRAHGGFPSEAELARAAGVDEKQTQRGRRRLEELGLLHLGDGLLEPVEPETALLRTMSAYQASAAQQASAAAALQQLTDALMSVYRPAVAGEASLVEVEYITGSRRKNRTLGELAATTRQGVDSMHPGPMPPSHVLEASLERDADMRSRGVRLRSIYPQTLLQTPKYVRYLQRLSGTGAEVRLLDHAPCDVLIHDDSAACLPGAPGGPEGPMLLVRGPALVRVVSGFYEDFWLRAVPFEQATRAAAAGDSVAELTPQERTVIRLMAGGLTDDQIARKMGVHRRTVQRAVSKLMERLHASSRFEAGLKLAQDPEFARTLRGAPSAQPPSTRARSSSASAEAGSAAPASGAAGHAASAPPASGAAGPPDPPPSAPPAGSPPAPSAAAPGAAVPGAAAHAAGRPG
jgi:DNA-binding CsgD family transcriptional regulator